MAKNNFKYLDFDVYYLPHPSLVGNWEVFNGDNFIERVSTKKQAKEKIKNMASKLPKPTRLSERT